MKSVCKFCGNNQLVKWGGRRRYCGPCDKTFRVKKAGRRRTKKINMYLLDRSTFQRIASKAKARDTTILRGLHKELKPVPSPLEFLKKIYIPVQKFWSLTPNTCRLRE